MTNAAVDGNEHAGNEAWRRLREWAPVAGVLIAVLALMVSMFILYGQTMTRIDATTDRIDATGVELAASIEASRAELAASIEASRAELAASIEASRAELAAKVDAINARIDANQSATTERLDSVLFALSVRNSQAPYERERSVRP